MSAVRHRGHWSSSLGVHPKARGGVVHGSIADVLGVGVGIGGGCKAVETGGRRGRGDGTSEIR